MGLSVKLRAKKGGHVEKIGTEVRSPRPTEVGQLVKIKYGQHIKKL
jgi:hypothetical protein